MTLISTDNSCLFVAFVAKTTAGIPFPHIAIFKKTDSLHLQHELF